MTKSGANGSYIAKPLCKGEGPGDGVLECSVVALLLREGRKLGLKGMSQGDRVIRQVCSKSQATGSGRGFPLKRTHRGEGLEAQWPTVGTADPSRLRCINECRQFAVLSRKTSHQLF